MMTMNDDDDEEDDDEEDDKTTATTSTTTTATQKIYGLSAELQKRLWERFCCVLAASTGANRCGITHIFEIEKFISTCCETRFLEAATHSTSIVSVFSTLFCSPSPEIVIFARDGPEHSLLRSIWFRKNSQHSFSKRRTRKRSSE